MSDPRIFPGDGTEACSGFWRRFLAGLVDSVILATVLWLFLSVAGMSAAALAGLDAAAFANGPHGAAGLMAESMIVPGVAAAVLIFLYKVGFEVSAKQATPGKMALGLRVANAEGERLSVGAATLRAWPWWTPAIVLLADALLGTEGLFSSAAFLAAAVSFLVAAFVVGRQGIHDMMAGALVLGRAAGLGSAAAAP